MLLIFLSPSVKFTMFLVPYLIMTITLYHLVFCPVVGDKECESGTVNVRSRLGKQLGRRSAEEVLKSFIQLRDTRSNEEEF